MTQTCLICGSPKGRGLVTCGSKQCATESRARTNLKRYGHVNPLGGSSSCIEKRNKTVLERYGISNVFGSKLVQETIKQTNLTKYGVENSGGSKEVQEKLQRTKLKRYGNPTFTNPEKAEQTCLERYGVRHHYQVPEIFNKVFKKRHKVISPSGKEIYVQGYERHYIHILWEKHGEDNVLASNIGIPTFSYIGVDNKQHIYYPDFYVKTINTIYEIKSLYTYKKDKTKIKLVQPVIESQGYNYEVIIYP